MANTYKDYDLLVTGELLYDKQERGMIPTGFILLPPGSLLSLLGMPIGSMDRSIDFVVHVIQPTSPYTKLLSRKVSVPEAANSMFGLMWGEGKRKFKVPFFDACPTEIMAPEFLKIRNALAEALQPDGKISQAMEK